MIAEVTKNVFYALMANGCTYCLLVLVNAVRFMIQGMGFSTLAIFAGLAELVGRAFIGIVLVPILGFKGACLASPASSSVLSVPFVPSLNTLQQRDNAISQASPVASPYRNLAIGNI